MNDTFIGAAEYVIESIHDLLAGDSKSFSGFDSSRGSHHPSWERFMVETPEGRAERVHEAADSPRDDDNHDEGAGALLHMQEEHLRALRQELKEAWLQLKQECVELEQGIARQGDNGCARARDHEVT